MTDLDIDFENLALTFSYILGPVLREELAKRGAALRDRDEDKLNCVAIVCTICT